MAKIIYLAAGEDHPEFDDDERWIVIDVSSEGKFYGTGASWKQSGEAVFYRSLCESDVSLDSALIAAQEWAAKYEVPKISVQLEPWSGR